ncbi:MAG: TlpA family protein disulfide reductase [Saprospiraceae bacterium]|nr:TlpA family protein disulfide reductase [Saprospiraceae bacterium]MCB9329099.1 TlpA family protein disulfide reductase [Lewinellaceae bacterium]
MKYTLIYLMTMSIISCTNKLSQGISNSEIIILKTAERPFSPFGYETFERLKPDIVTWNLRAGIYENDDLRFKLGIFDKDKNGKYNDCGTDILFVSQVDDKYVQYNPTVSASACVLEKMTTLKFNQQYYQIQICEKDRQLKVTRLDSVILMPELDSFDQMPDVEIKTVEGEYINLKDVEYDNIPVLLNFWASWCPPCIDKFETFKNIEKSKLRIINISSDEDIDCLSVINQLDGSDVGSFYLSDKGKLNRLFNQNGYPFLVLFENGKPINYDQAALIEFLKNENLTK